MGVEEWEGEEVVEGDEGGLGTLASYLPMLVQCGLQARSLR